MSSKTDIWMPFYVSDYIKDTTHLSTQEHGAYFLLLLQTWINKGALPVDEERLRLITRLDTRAWKKSKEELLSFFYEHEGVLRNKRIDDELGKAQANKVLCSIAGKASAAKRKGQRNTQPKVNGRSTDVATEHPTEPSTEHSTKLQPKVNTSPSPTSLTTKTKERATLIPASAEVSGLAFDRKHTRKPPENRPNSSETEDLKPEVRLALSLRKANIVGANAINPHVVRFAEIGATVEHLAAAIEVAKGRGINPIPVKYLVPIVDDLLDPNFKKPSNGSAWWASDKGREEKAKELGISARPGESMSEFSARINAEIAKQKSVLA